jgi:hypothetical protein
LIYNILTTSSPVFPLESLRAISYLIIYFQFQLLFVIWKVCGQYHTILPRNLFGHKLTSRCNITGGLIATSEYTLMLLLTSVKLLRCLFLNSLWLYSLLSKINRNVKKRIIFSFYMKLKVYNKKAINLVWENMMTSLFVAYGRRTLGPSTRQKNQSSYFPIQRL